MTPSRNFLSGNARRQAAFVAACLLATLLAHAAAPAEARASEGRVVLCGGEILAAAPVSRDSRKDDFIERAGLAGAVREALRTQVVEPQLPRACSGDWQFRFSSGEKPVSPRAADAVLHPSGIERRHASRAPPLPDNI